MLILEHEGEDHKEKVFLSQKGDVSVLESFIFLSIGKVFCSAVVCLSCLLIYLTTHMHERKNQLVTKASFFNKLINGSI